MVVTEVFLFTYDSWLFPQIHFGKQNVCLEVTILHMFAQKYRFLPHIIFLVFFRTSSETFTAFTEAKALCGETWKDIYFPLPIAAGVFNRFFNSI